MECHGEADHEFQTYFPQLDYRAADAGFVQPYADGPLTDGYFAEDVYLNLIKSAKHFFYAATPYLIISDDMTRELCLAAERGVDVRIVTPGIPDKKLVYQTTRSYYAPLVRRGVRIYEYTPGFIHQKQTLCDGRRRRSERSILTIEACTIILKTACCCMAAVHSVPSERILSRYLRCRAR